MSPALDFFHVLFCIELFALQFRRLWPRRLIAVMEAEVVTIMGSLQLFLHKWALLLSRGSEWPHNDWNFANETERHHPPSNMLMSHTLLACGHCYLSTYSNTRSTNWLRRCAPPHRGLTPPAAYQNVQAGIRRPEKYHLLPLRKRICYSRKQGLRPPHQTSGMRTSRTVGRLIDIIS